MKSLMGSIQGERNTRKQLEEEKKKLMKVDIANESLSQNNQALLNKVKDLENVNHNLREEIFVCKSKMTENDASTDKMNQYL